MKCMYYTENDMDLIDFEHVMKYPEMKYQIWEKFRFDTTFNNKVNEKIAADSAFKNMWFRFFANFYKTLAIPEEELKRTTSKSLVYRYY